MGQQLFDSISHLFGGLVGESHRQDLLRSADSLINQISDFVSDGSGFPTSRSCQNKHGSFGLGYGKFLMFVQMG